MSSDSFPPITDNPSAGDVIAAVKFSHGVVVNRLERIEKFVDGHGGGDGARAAIERLEMESKGVKFLGKAALTASVTAICAVMVKLMKLV